MYTIFISHNSKDKPVVEPIALRLANAFGQDEVFYDSWSIKPGEGIIDKMNQGLGSCRFVFFFVSNNSLKSYMVNIEWQNALMKASNGLVRLIPVRMDNCDLPAILTQTLYLDLFNNGIEATITSMVELVKGQDTFHAKFTQVNNLSANFIKRTDREIEIELSANYFMEPTPHFVFVTSNNDNEINFEIIGVNIMRFGFNKGVIPLKGDGFNVMLNGIRIDLPDSLVPGFPRRIKFTAKTDKPITILYVMHEDKQNLWKIIKSN
uniref:toll/interleukin-1 receptor domain-containing protein n=1 Tax=Phocaeicola vulgatus TaxID=821 RepID=UPI004025E562